MNIALLAPSFIPATRANTIQTMKMADAFAALGHTLRVFVPGADPYTPWPKLAAHYGLAEQFELVYLPASPALRRYDYAYRAVHAALAWGADLLFTRLPQAAALASRHDLPTIFEAHDMPGGWMGAILLRAFLIGDGRRGLVAITHALARDLHTHHGAPQVGDFTVVLPDGVDLARYEGLPAAPAARARLGLPEKFTVGYTGHLYAGRGIELLLELARRLPDVNVLLVGGTPKDVERVRTSAPDNVTLTGFVPNVDLPQYQAACDALLMPYQQHVAASSGGDIARYLSPMKMFEYLASGRPIIASDLPVLHEVLVAGENALIMPAQDVTAWVDAIQRLQADSALRAQLSATARNTAAVHTWANRAQAIVELAGAR